MQFNTKRGLVDIPNEEILAAARALGLSALPTPDQQGHRKRSRLADGWASIESAPRDGTKILAFWKGVPGGRNAYGTPFYENGGWVEDDEPVSDPSYWMPLPPMPNTTMSRAQPSEALGGALDPRPPKDKC